VEQEKIKKATPFWLSQELASHPHPHLAQLVTDLHSKKSDDYMPQESGAMERASIKMHMTFHQLHAPQWRINKATLEVHAASETSYTFRGRPTPWIHFPEP